MPQIEFRNVQPSDAIAFFDKKSALLRESFDWREVWQEEHARQFTVAKSAGRDILGDIYSATRDAIVNGTTFEDFRKRLKPILQDKGWWGTSQALDPRTGQMVTVQLGSTRRLKTIYDTNISMSFAAGRWDRVWRLRHARPYLLYDHLDGQKRPRLHHKVWDNIALPITDPVWRWLYPPNGWGCHCSVISLSQAQYDNLKKAGKIKTDPPPELMREYTNTRTGQTIKVHEGVDPGFDYNVGVAHGRELTPPPLDGEPGVSANSLTRQLYPAEGRPPMPPPRAARSSDILARGKPDADYIAAFMDELGALAQAGGQDFQPDLGKAQLLDPIGLPLTITDRFFLRDDGTSKIDSHRAPFVRLLARALLAPDEIWMSFELVAAGIYQLRRRYVARWAVPGQKPAVLVLEEGKDGWRGVTAFAGRGDSYLDNQVRLGWLAYTRGR